MSLIGIILAGIILAVGGYFVVELTIEWIRKKIYEDFRKEYEDVQNGEIDRAFIADINEMIDNCPNRKSYETLKEAREQGYTHVMGKISGGKLTGKIDLIKDKNDTLDPEVEELLGSEKMAVIEI